MYRIIETVLSGTGRRSDRLKESAGLRLPLATVLRTWARYNSLSNYYGGLALRLPPK